MDPLPSLNKVYSLVIQEEQPHLIPAVGDESTSLLNVAQRYQARVKNVPNQGGKSNSKYCTFCHRTNHVVEFCYDKHGHPNQSRNGGSVNASNTEEEAPSNEVIEAGSSATVNNSITQDQFYQLMALLQQVHLPASATPSSSNVNQISLAHGLSPNEPSTCMISSLICSVKSHSSAWILDSGASDHICSSIHWFTSFYSIPLVHVKLPTGNSVTVHHAGSIMFSPTLSIHHVQYSPIFNLNLISVNKLCKSLGCELLFNDHNCTL
jgi:hypothetical protein